MSDLESKTMLLVEIKELRGVDDRGKAYEVISQIIGPMTEKSKTRGPDDRYGEVDDLDEYDGEIEYFRFAPKKHGGLASAHQYEGNRWAIAYPLHEGKDEGGMFYCFLPLKSLAKIVKKINKKIKKAGLTPGEPCLESKTWYNGSDEPITVAEDEPEEEPPYLTRVNMKVKKLFNPKYDMDRICKCGHPYHRHFDGYEDLDAVGCKYCKCFTFKEGKSATKSKD